ncbi:Nicotinamide phosphoribosyltransferase, partial [Taenia solium]
VDVCKHPITDPQKHSKKGRLCLQRSASQNGFVTMEEGQGDLEKDLLVTVYENGRLLVDNTLDKTASYSNGFVGNAHARVSLNGCGRAISRTYMYTDAPR